jgi:hypothetical protein
MPADIPRLLPEEPLPRYAFVPGRSPHPVSDPAGHSFGQTHPPPVAIDPENWPVNRDYLCGFDLFNHGYFWEAHETWEGLWHAAGRRGPTACFLKALIKLAAAGVKHLEGKPSGVKSHARRAAELWREASVALDGPDFLGLQIASLITLADTLTRDGWPDEPPILRPVGTGLTGDN